LAVHRALRKVQELQRERLGTATELAEWAPALDKSPPVVGCVLTNEVLDNFPFHQLQIDRHGEVREVYVDLDGERL
jgi:SAM-dependent MidA family methyltransferase